MKRNISTTLKSFFNHFQDQQNNQQARLFCDEDQISNKKNRQKIIPNSNKNYNYLITNQKIDITQSLGQFKENQKMNEQKDYQKFQKQDNKQNLNNENGQTFLSQQQIKRQKKQKWQKYLKQSLLQKRSKREKRKQKRESLRKWANYPSQKIKQLLMIVAGAFILSYILAHIFPSFGQVQLVKSRHNLSDRPGEGKNQFEIRFKMSSYQSRPVMGYSLAQLGMDRWIQVGTQLDYFNVYLKKTHKHFKSKYTEYFRYNVYLLQHNKRIFNGIQSDIEQGPLSKIRAENKEVNKKEQKINNIKMIERELKLKQELQIHLASSYVAKIPTLLERKFKMPGVRKQKMVELVNKMNKKQRQKLQMEYMSQKYNINQKSQHRQSSICIFSQIQDKLGAVQYARFFQSIQKQNYQNFKVVIIDDNPKQNISQSIIDHLRNKQNVISQQISAQLSIDEQNDKDEINNYLKYKKQFTKKVKIIKNDQSFGRLTSFYVHINQCMAKQIVVYLDFGDAFTSPYVLKILNQAYLDKSIWTLYSKSLIRNKSTNNQKKITNQKFQQGRSRQLLIQASEYRQSDQQVVSNLLSHRTQLIPKFPMEHFIEYQYHEQRGRLHPRFLRVDKKIWNNKSLIYCLIQLCTNLHLRFLDQFLYYQDLSSQRKVSELQRKQVGMLTCEEQLIKVDEYKIKIKRPMKPLQTLSTYYQFAEGRNIKQQILTNYLYFTDNYRSCLRKNHQQIRQVQRPSFT